MFGFCTLDTDLNITQWDTWLANVTGKPSGEVLGRHVADVFPDLRPRGLLAALEYAAETAAPVMLSWRLHHYFFAPADGEPFPQSALIDPVFEGDVFTALRVSVQDVRDRRAAEDELLRRIRQLEALRKLDQLILRGDLEATLQYVVETVTRLLGGLHAEIFLIEGAHLVLRAAWGLLNEDAPRRVPLEKGLIGRAAQKGEPFFTLRAPDELGYLQVDARTQAEAVVPIIGSDGTVLGVLNLESDAPQTLLHGGVLEFMDAVARQVAVALHADASRWAERKRLEDVQTLRSLGVQLTGARDIETIYASIVQAAAHLFEAPAVWLYLHATLYDGASPLHRVSAFPQDGAGDAPAGISPEVFSREMEAGNPIVWNEPPFPAPLAGLREQWRSVALLPLSGGRGVLGLLLLGFAAPWKFAPEDIHVLNLFTEQLDAHLRSWYLQLDSLQNLAELQALHQVSLRLREAGSSDDLLRLTLEAAMQVLNVDRGVVFKRIPGVEELSVVYARGWGLQDGGLSPKMFLGDSLAGKVLLEGSPRLVPNLAEIPLDSLPDWVRDILRREAPSAIFVPIKVPDVFDAVFVLGAPPERHLEERDVHLMDTISQMASTAIQRNFLHERTRQQMERLLSLNQLTTAINASVDVSLSLTVLLEEARKQLQVDAAAAFLRQPPRLALQLQASLGLPMELRSALRNISLDGSFPGISLSSNRPRVVPDLTIAVEHSRYQALFLDAGFRACVVFPLMVKGQVRGALMYFFRQPFTPDFFWMEFAETLGKVASMAVDMSAMFSDLQRANMELRMAYDATIEGWSRALELRDNETKGHSDRVTDMSVQLAALMGFQGDDLTAVRWGALLHDIGKMGIPDSILHKPGPLTAEEWRIMQQHPVYAYNLLREIEFLRPALDIPYCHHERWDGTGYPRGLKGEEIPLSARVFAVVDVWDALTSDRPYRKAWHPEKAVAYIAEQRGIHFDPQVADTFLHMLEQSA